MSPAPAATDVTGETGLTTEFAFELPIGYEDEDGVLHRHGVMRLARARDEIAPSPPPQRGDVVVLHPPTPSQQPYIKRIIGLPGESIEFRNGFVYIDGERLEEPYIEQGITRCGNSPYCSIDEIPDGYVYVLGDNRNNSSDSRSFGLVAIDEIVGKAWFTNWPLTDIGLVPHYDYQQ